MCTYLDLTYWKLLVSRLVPWTPYNAKFVLAKIVLSISWTLKMEDTRQKLQRVPVDILSAYQIVPMPGAKWKWCDFRVLFEVRSTIVSTILHAPPQEVGENVEQMPELALGTVKLNKGNLENLTQRFSQKFHWSFTKNEKPGKHLEFNNPALVAIREFIQGEVDHQRVHPRLVCNWDQVWTLSYEPLRRVAFKRKEKFWTAPSRRDLFKSWIMNRMFLCQFLSVAKTNMVPKLEFPALGSQDFFVFLHVQV